MPETEAQFRARLRRHRHNGHFGSAKMMQAQCRAVLQSDSTTSDAKNIARKILADAERLYDALRVRVDPKEST